MAQPERQGETVSETKKKRVPKPPMIEATRWLIDIALPLFNSDIDNWDWREIYAAGEKLGYFFDEEFPYRDEMAGDIREAIKWGKLLFQETFKAIQVYAPFGKEGTELAKFARCPGGARASELLKEANEAVQGLNVTKFVFMVRTDRKCCLGQKPLILLGQEP
jgi:hypothetical protein